MLVSICHKKAPITDEQRQSPPFFSHLLRGGWEVVGREHFSAHPPARVVAGAELPRRLRRRPVETLVVLLDFVVVVTAAYVLIATTTATAAVVLGASCRQLPLGLGLFHTAAATTPAYAMLLLLLLVGLVLRGFPVARLGLYGERAVLRHLKGGRKRGNMGEKET